jgi:hypothetical protein
MISNDFKKLFVGFSIFGVALFSTMQLHAAVFQPRAFVPAVPSAAEVTNLPKVVQAQRIDNGTPNVNKRLGRDIDISNQSHKVIISAAKDGSGFGKAFLYEPDANGTFQKTQTFKLDSGDDAASFGVHVAISEDFVVIGTLNDSFYIYKKNASGNWPLMQKLDIAKTNNVDDRPFKLVYKIGEGIPRLVIADKGSKTLRVWRFVEPNSQFVLDKNLAPSDTDLGSKDFPVAFGVSVQGAAGDDQPFIVASDGHYVYRWGLDYLNKWKLQDWNNNIISYSDATPFVIGTIPVYTDPNAPKNHLELPYLARGGFVGGGIYWIQNQGAFGEQIALFKRDLLISTNGEQYDNAQPFYTGFQYFRTESTDLNAPFVEKSMVPIDPININNAYDPATATVVLNDKPPVDFAFINGTLASVTNLGYLANTATNPYANKGYVILNKRDSSTDTFKLYKALLTPTNITKKLTRVAMSGQYVVASAPGEPLDGVDERGAVFIWKYSD